MHGIIKLEKDGVSYRNVTDRLENMFGGFLPWRNDWLQPNTDIGALRWAIDQLIEYGEVETVNVLEMREVRPMAEFNVWMTRPATESLLIEVEAEDKEEAGRKAQAEYDRRVRNDDWVMLQFDLDENTPSHDETYISDIVEL